MVLVRINKIKKCMVLHADKQNTYTVYVESECQISVLHFFLQGYTTLYTGSRLFSQFKNQHIAAFAYELYEIPNMPNPVECLKSTLKSYVREERKVIPPVNTFLKRQVRRKNYACPALVKSNTTFLAKNTLGYPADRSVPSYSCALYTSHTWYMQLKRVKYIGKRKKIYILRNNKN